MFLIAVSFRLLTSNEKRNNMTKQEAIETIYKIINSGIIDIELENELTEVASCIEDDSFEEE